MQSLEICVFLPLLPIPVSFEAPACDLVYKIWCKKLD